ncbi:MAG: hypothetical protein RSA84_15685, partial [Acinetobacter sp.]
MNESPNGMIESLKIITAFISENSISLLILALAAINKQAISTFISRLISLHYKNGDSSLGLQALAPNNDNIIEREQAGSDENSSIEKTEIKVDTVDDEILPYSISIRMAFENGRFEEADKHFRKYASEETDPIKLDELKSFYLYNKFRFENDSNALKELEGIAELAKTEESKLNCTIWLSFCYTDGSQYKKDANLWRNFLEKINNENIKTKAIISLANSLENDGTPGEAKTLIVERLVNTVEDIQKAELYRALSSIEKSLGNNSASIYCRDKSLEFDTHNRSELFNSAYTASTENIDFISISNYTKLLKIDMTHAAALNNIGVQAKEAKLNIV